MARRSDETPTPGLAMYLPGWWQDTSGLLLPSSRPRPASVSPARDLPSELRPTLAPVAVEQQPPSALDQIMVYIDEDTLGLGHSSLAEVQTRVALLPAAPALASIARLAARVHQLGFEASQQVALARAFYGDCELCDHLAALVSADPSRRIFADQQVHLLMWLLILYGHQGSPDEAFSREHHDALCAALLGCTSVVGDQTKRMFDSESVDDWLGYFVQLSSCYRHEMPMPPLARASELLRLARDSRAREHPQFCPLDDWHEEAYGLDIDEQLRLGLGLSAMAHAWDQHEEAGSQVYLSPDVVDDFLLKAGLRDRRRQALALISASQTEFAEALRETARDPTHLIWETTPFKRFAFLRCSDGGLILLSPAFIQSWLTDGFHYRSLLAAQNFDRARTGKKRNGGSRAQRYLNFIGTIYERYCLALAQSAHSRPGLQAAR